MARGGRAPAGRALAKRERFVAVAVGRAVPPVGRAAVDGALAVRLRVRLLGGQRPGDVLERLLLGADTEAQLRQAADRHRDGADEEAGGDLGGVAGVDERAEDTGPAMPPTAVPTA